MTTQGTQTAIHLTFKIVGPSQDPTISVIKGKSARATIVAGAVFRLLQIAARDAGKFPAIASSLPAEGALTVSGRLPGLDELDQLLEVFETAARSLGHTVEHRTKLARFTLIWKHRAATTIDKASEIYEKHELKKGPSRSAFTELEDIETRVTRLWDRLVPKVTSDDIREFQEILRQSQVNAPADKVGFVEKVNEILDASGLRLKTETGELGRLKLAETGSIQITRASGGSRGFQNASISLVGVERIRVGNRHTKSTERNP